jgi:hypothetical protein
MKSLATVSDGFATITSAQTPRFRPFVLESGWNGLLIGKSPSNILSRLEEFEGYTVGWHFGEGVGFSPEVLQTIKEISGLATELGYSDQGISPGTSGDLQLSIFLPRKNEIEIFVAPTGMITILVFKNGDYTDDDLETSDLEEVRQWLSSFESSMREIYIQKSPGSPASHYYLPREKTVEFQYSA